MVVVVPTPHQPPHGDDDAKKNKKEEKKMTTTTDPTAAAPPHLVHAPGDPSGGGGGGPSSADIDRSTANRVLEKHLHDVELAAAAARQENQQETKRLAERLQVERVQQHLSITNPVFSLAAYRALHQRHFYSRSEELQYLRTYYFFSKQRSLLWSAHVKGLKAELKEMAIAFHAQKDWLGHLSRLAEAEQSIVGTGLGTGKSPRGGEGENVSGIPPVSQLREALLSSPSIPPIFYHAARRQMTAAEASSPPPPENNNDNEIEPPSSTILLRTPPETSGPPHPSLVGTPTTHLALYAATRDIPTTMPHAHHEKGEKKTTAAAAPPPSRWSSTPARMPTPRRTLPTPTHNGVAAITPSLRPGKNTPQFGGGGARSGPKEKEEEEDSSRASPRIPPKKNGPSASSLAHPTDLSVLVQELRKNLARRDTDLDRLRLEHHALLHSQQTQERELRSTRQHLQERTEERNSLQHDMCGKAKEIQDLQDVQKTTQEALTDLQSQLRQVSERNALLELIQDPARRASERRRRSKKKERRAIHTKREEDEEEEKEKAEYRHRREWRKRSSGEEEEEKDGGGGATWDSTKYRRHSGSGCRKHRAGGGTHHQRQHRGKGGAQGPHRHASSRPTGHPERRRTPHTRRRSTPDSSRSFSSSSSSRSSSGGSRDGSFSSSSSLVSQEKHPKSRSLGPLLAEVHRLEEQLHHYRDKCWRVQDEMEGLKRRGEVPRGVVGGHGGGGGGQKREVSSSPTRTKGSVESTEMDPTAPLLGNSSPPTTTPTAEEVVEWQRELLSCKEEYHRLQRRLERQVDTAQFREAELRKEQAEATRLQHTAVRALEAELHTAQRAQQHAEEERQQAVDQLRRVVQDGSLQEVLQGQKDALQQRVSELTQEVMEAGGRAKEWKLAVQRELAEKLRLGEEKAQLERVLQQRTQQLRVAEQEMQHLRQRVGEAEARVDVLHARFAPLEADGEKGMAAAPVVVDDPLHRPIPDPTIVKEEEEDAKEKEHTTEKRREGNGDVDGGKTGKEANAKQFFPAATAIVAGGGGGGGGPTATAMPSIPPPLLCGHDNPDAMASELKGYTALMRHHCLQQQRLVGLEEELMATTTALLRLQQSVPPPPPPPHDNQDAPGGAQPTENGEEEEAAVWMSPRLVELRNGSLHAEILRLHDALEEHRKQQAILQQKWLDLRSQHAEVEADNQLLAVGAEMLMEKLSRWKSKQKKTTTAAKRTETGRTPPTAVVSPPSSLPAPAVLPLPSHALSLTTSPTHSHALLPPPILFSASSSSAAGVAVAVAAVPSTPAKPTTAAISLTRQRIETARIHDQLSASTLGRSSPRTVQTGEGVPPPTTPTPHTKEEEENKKKEAKSSSEKEAAVGSSHFMQGVVLSPPSSGAPWVPHVLSSSPRGGTQKTNEKGEKKTTVGATEPPREGGARVTVVSVSTCLPTAVRAEENRREDPNGRKKEKKKKEEVVHEGAPKVPSNEKKASATVPKRRRVSRTPPAPPSSSTHPYAPPTPSPLLFPL